MNLISLLIYFYFTHNSLRFPQELLTPVFRVRYMQRFCKFMAPWYVSILLVFLFMRRKYFFKIVTLFNNRDNSVNEKAKYS